MDEDESGYDGPNIRPPQLKHESKGSSRARFSGSDVDRRGHSHHRTGGSGGSHHRRQDNTGTSSRGHSGSGSASREKSRSHYDSNRSRDRDHRRGADDLRNRLGNSAKTANFDNRHSSSSSRDKDRKERSRSSQSTHANESEQRLRKIEKERRDEEVRRQRREVERQMKAEVDKLKRKRDRSRSRTDDSVHRKHSKSEQPSSKDLAAAHQEASDDEEEEENGSEENESEEGSGSGSGSEDESGEVESSESSESSDDDDETGTDQSGATPEHDDEEGDEDEPVEIALKEVERMQAEKQKSSSSKNRKQNSPSKSDISEAEEHVEQNDRRLYAPSTSRTPSKSPTPRRHLEEEDTMEARMPKQKPPTREGSPGSRSSFADDMEGSGPGGGGGGGGQENRDNENAETDPEEEDIKLPPYLPSVYGCRSVEEFQCLNRIEEGTYGVVYRAKDKKTNKIVALKRLKMEREKEGFPITSLREINTLLISQHPNVVTVREIVVGSNMDKIYIVMDFVEHDLKSLMETMRQKKQVFLPGEVKCLMQQLLRAIAHLHDNWILHRDLKTSNLLLSHNGILKVGDFGLAREYGSPLKPYTAVVVTLWYRAPELLLGIKEYSTHIDVWSVGCIFGELLHMEPLFTGRSDLEQLQLIFKLLGTPNEKIWNGFTKLPVVQKAALPEYPASNIRQKFPPQMLSDAGINLLKRFLTYDPKKRISCDEALKADYFMESPRAIDPSMFPTWPAKSEGSTGGQAKKGASPKPPSGGGAFKKINEDEDEYSKYTGFVLNAGKAPPPPAPWNLKF